MKMPNTQSINHNLGQRLQALALVELPNALKKTGSEIECKVTQKMIVVIEGVSQNTISQLRQ